MNEGYWGIPVLKGESFRLRACPESWKGDTTGI
jgi:hypothetical protein